MEQARKKMSNYGVQLREKQKAKKNIWSIRKPIQNIL